MLFYQLSADNSCENFTLLPQNEFYFTIKDAEKEDAGIYICRLHNSQSKVSSFAHILRIICSKGLCLIIYLILNNL